MNDVIATELEAKRALLRQQLDAELAELDDVKVDGPYQRAILRALQSKHVYAGTVPARIIAQRRKAGKAAKLARKANR